MRYKENPRIRKKIEDGVISGLTISGIMLENETVNNLNIKVYNGTPKYYKLTGKLKQSYSYAINKMRRFINLHFGTNLNYAPFVEYPGIKRNYPGKPHVRPAYDKVKRLVKAIIGSEIRKKL